MRMEEYSGGWSPRVEAGQEVFGVHVIGETGVDMGGVEWTMAVTLTQSSLFPTFSKITVDESGMTISHGRPVMVHH